MLAVSVAAWKQVNDGRSAQRSGAQAWMPASTAAEATSVISASYSGSPSPKPEKLPRSPLAANSAVTPGMRAISRAFSTPSSVSIIRISTTLSFQVWR